MHTSEDVLPTQLVKRAQNAFMNGREKRVLSGRCLDPNGMGSFAVVSSLTKTIWVNMYLLGNIAHQMIHANAK